MERIATNSLDCFPKRPSKNTSGKALALATNYFGFESLNPNKSFFKYSVEFKPELPGDSVRLRQKIWRTARDKIKPHLGHTIFNNTTCYSKENYPHPIEEQIELQGQNYTILVKWTNLVDNNSLEALGLYKKFVGQLIRRINFLPIRRNYFDPKLARKVDNIEVWPGFNCSTNIFPNGIMINMNVIHKVLRNETALDLILKIKSKKDGNEFAEEIQETFKNCVVLTRYNNDKTYIIDSVDFSKTPMDCFTMKDDKNKSYLDYYKEKYNKFINDPNQPLLVSKDPKKNTVIHLIPEFCFLTGLTDEMRSNFNLMKQMAGITKGQPGDKMKECINLIDTFLKNEKCKQDIENWGISLSDKPVTLTGRKLDAGNILMHKLKDGSRFNFSIDFSDDIDRKIQTEMYSQPVIKKWLVFSTNKDKETTDNFLQMLKKVLESFNYPMSSPNVVYVKSNQFRDWEEAITKNISKDVQTVLLIIPGAKGKGFIYNDVKKLLTLKYPVPSQVVLASTLMKPKGLRSIVNKVLIQICAKVGGEPWAIDKLPFCNLPTMVVGIDLLKKSGKLIVGCCATFNNTFTKYISIAGIANSESEVNSVVSKCVAESLKHFSAINKISPQHIIILRDGISPSQIKSCKKEIELIKVELNAIKLSYILINKKNTLKVFQIDNNNYLNIPPGTLVDDIVVNTDTFDFFLISQKTNQGLSQATHYNVIYDDFSLKTEDLHYFIYKMCYLYYNWTGGIKIPAPCQYAKKLAFLVGEKISTNREFKLPDARFLNEIRSLYFL